MVYKTACLWGIYFGTGEVLVTILVYLLAVVIGMCYTNFFPIVICVIYTCLLNCDILAWCCDYDLFN